MKNQRSSPVQRFLIRADNHTRGTSGQSALLQTQCLRCDLSPLVHVLYKCVDTSIAFVFYLD